MKDGKIGRRCDLITDKVSCHVFMDEFKSVIIPKYVELSQYVKWLTVKFHICKNTFPIGTILLVVYFVENYILAPQDEVQ